MFELHNTEKINYSH